MKKVIIDTDTGIDDALGCALALESPELDILAFTSIFGNVSVELTTENTAYLMEVYDRTDIPLARGAARALVGTPNYADFVHGQDGVGNAGYPKATKVKPVEKNAAQLTVDLAHEHPGEITYIALGPLTNLALAMQIDPTLPEVLKSVVWMGGNVWVPGNVTPVAEADAWHDPEAAQIVLQEPGWKVTMVGLDVTDDTLFYESELAHLKAAGPRGEYLAAMLPFYIDFYENKLEQRACAMHSALTVGVVVDESLITEVEELPVQVELNGTHTRGMTVADRRLNASNGGEKQWPDTPDTRIVKDVNREGFRSQLLSRLTGGAYDPAKA
ncbi:nucleoside hydrolase [Epibacterium sp. Ofav1-8]|uniref:nucleoside hydrolase n=1 Tax=Epibacterium sp. Ofav1-8 TaxID=2917735 RepID=UPI001EF685FA|nr:nucleoside hydrolase [Epibacterium sp. Ofav1-8]MCG7625082.1 nucleoside hydrolase [Epibacterium sp. Ofav1-8]